MVSHRQSAGALDEKTICRELRVHKKRMTEERAIQIAACLIDSGITERSLIGKLNFDDLRDIQPKLDAGEKAAVRNLETVLLGASCNVCGTANCWFRRTHLL